MKSEQTGGSSAPQGRRVFWEARVREIVAEELEARAEKRRRRLWRWLGHLRARGTA